MKNFKSLSDKQFKRKTITANQSSSSYKKMLVMRGSNRWEQTSKTIRNKWVICQNRYCEQPATSVHHIRDAHTNLDIFFLESNLIPLCEQHHRKADNQSINERDQMIKYWQDKINIYRTTGEKNG